MARFTVALIRSQSCGVVVPTREGKADIVYLAMYTIFPLHKTHVGYLVRISDLGCEPQRDYNTMPMERYNNESQLQL